MLTIKKDEVISLKEFCVNNAIKSLSNVRENVNGYPFITVLTVGESGTEAENVYFSKNLTEKVSVGDSPKTYRDFYVRLTVNANSEERIKLCSSSEYTDINSLWD